MFDRTNRTLICSIVFLDIVDYSRHHVAEQLRLKERFNAVLSEALLDIAVNDRIILDTGDGAAVSFLGAPEDALFVAMNLRDMCTNLADPDHQLPIRIGINLGPVRQVKDLNGRPNLIGDGINVAQRVMSFGEPGVILVSRSYYEVVSRLSEEYALLFEYEGMRTDKHVREHEIYTVGDTGAARLHSIEKREASKRRSASPRAIQQQRSKIRIAAGAGLLTCAAVAAAWWGLVREGSETPAHQARIDAVSTQPNQPPASAPKPTMASVTPAPPVVTPAPVPTTTQPVVKPTQDTPAAKPEPKPGSKPASTSPAASSTSAPPSARTTPKSSTKTASASHTAKAASTANRTRTEAEKPVDGTKALQDQAPPCLPGECWPNGKPKRDK